MPKWGNPILQELITSEEKRRMKAQKDALALAKRRPQNATPERSFARLGGFLGPNVEFGGYAPTYDEIFLEAIVRQRQEAQQRGFEAQRREEAAHPEFYRRERRRNALPW